MDDELRITTDVGDVVDIYLCPHKTPVAYQRKKKELMESCGMTEDEVEQCLLRPIPIELFYSYDQGLWGIEAECLSACEVYDPYTGKEIPNDNLHYPIAPSKYTEIQSGIIEFLEGLVHRRFTADELNKILSEKFNETIRVENSSLNVSTGDHNFVFGSENEDTYGYFDLYYLPMRIAEFEPVHKYYITEVAYEFE